MVIDEYLRAKEKLNQFDRFMEKFSFTDVPEIVAFSEVKMAGKYVTQQYLPEYILDEFNKSINKNFENIFGTIRSKFQADVAKLSLSVVQEYNEILEEANLKIVDGELVQENQE